MFKGLPSYAKWLLKQPLQSLRPPTRNVHYVDMVGGSATGLLLHREGTFQAEIFTVLPSDSGSSFPEHNHPNVDSIEYVLSGRIAFTIDSKRVTSDEFLDSGLHIGLKLPVRAGRMHGGSVGPGGAAFVSIQRWLNGVQPTSVFLDWDGPSHLGMSRE